ncbi:MAG TPA: ThuA domain-containing protein [Edaphobacter sp.]|nr:ThuA domain-containing protein [Edaphobacter sp.]
MRKSIHLLSLVAISTAAAFAQSAAPAAPAPGSLDAADRRTSAPPPMRGTESKRWESWSNMRMAASPLLGWKIGIRADAFPNLYLADALEKIDGLSIGNVEIFSNQKFDMEIPKNVDDKLYPDEVRAVTDKLIAMNIEAVAYHVPSLGPDESSIRSVLSLAQTLKATTVVTDQLPGDLALVDRLAKESKLQIAICGMPKEILAAIGSKTHLGVCGDTGQWLEHGVKPVDAVTQLKDRLLILNLRDKSSSGKGGHDVLPGSGVAEISKLLLTMYHQQIKPSLITISSHAGTLDKSVETFDEALRPVMSDRVDGISRTAAIRTPASLTTEDRSAIEAALPKQAIVKPKKARKLLVLDLNVAYGGHRSIPAENFAIEQMGKQTGAYETVFDNNLDNLKYPHIKEYDAIFLNNTVGMIFVDPEVREGLTHFVREGGGLAGNHGTSHASMDWPEFSNMIGVRRGVHRANTEQAWVKITDPKSKLTTGFNGKEFLYEDEYFRFPNPPYSRTKLHELLSIDVAKSNMNQGVVHVPGSSVARPDADYAVSWIKSYGNGRVFFSILGHNATLFKSPELAQYFLSGIQFILGDLDADMTPSSPAAHSPTKMAAR